LKSIAAIALIVFVVSVACAEPLDDAQKAYERGDYETPIKIWKPLAEQGVARAQNGLGIMYYFDRSVPIYYAEAANVVGQQELSHPGQTHRQTALFAAHGSQISFIIKYPRPQGWEASILVRVRHPVGDLVARACLTAVFA
jgi:hypothetical protein